MLKPIFLKENEKIRGLWIAILVANCLLMIYIFTDIRQLFLLNHAEIIWYRAIQLDNIFYSNLKYAPTFTGALLACAQYIPEMQGERLRLSLHLPISPHLLILGHVLVGFTALSIILLLDMAGLAYIINLHFPIEFINSVILTTLPWMLAGFVAYLGVTLALLEPHFKLKAFNLCLTCGILGIFLQPVHSGGYLHVLPILACIVVLMIFAVFLPAYRFRYRSES